MSSLFRWVARRGVNSSSDLRCAKPVMEKTRCYAKRSGWVLSGVTPTGANWGRVRFPAPCADG
jgi:hypothetical protein